MVKRRQRVNPITLANDSGGYTVYEREQEVLLISFPHAKRNGVYTSGGPFLCYKNNVKLKPAGTVTYFNGLTNTSRTGQPSFAGVSPTSPGFTADANITKAGNTAQGICRTDGAKGFRRARPGNPIADGGLTSIELYKDGLPFFGTVSRLIGKSIWQWPVILYRELNSLRKLGSAYLEFNFGLRPLINDIKRMYQAQREIEKRISQIRRDNGKGIRRRVSISNTLDTSSSTSVYPGGIPQMVNNPATYGNPWSNLRTTIVTETKLEEKRWFVGKFRYYVPNIESPEWGASAITSLFGYKPTVEMLWNALPWTWLIDWFTNMGDIVSNMSHNAVDNTVAEYAYSMRSYISTETKTATITGTGRNDGNWKVPDIALVAVRTDVLETKCRIPATPFGFGVTFDGLSSYQAGIAAAFGFSRSRF